MTESFKELYANLQRQQEELKKQAQEAPTFRSRVPI